MVREPEVSGNRIRRWLILAAGVLGAAAGVVGLVIYHRAAALTPEEEWPVATGLPGAVAFSLAGAALLGFPKARIVALVMLASGLLGGLSLLLSGLALRSVATDVGSLSLASDVCSTVAYYLGLAVLPQVFPGGLPKRRGWRFAFSTSLVLMLLLAVLALRGGTAPYLDNELGWLVFVLAVYSGLAVGCVSLIVRWRQGSRLVRQQVGPFAVTVVVTMIMMVLAMLPWKLWFFGEAVLTLFPSAAVVAIGIATLQHRLYDVRVVIRRVAMFGILTAAMAVVFACVYALVLAAVSERVAGEEHRWVAVASALAVLVASEPLRRRAAAALERRLLGERHDPLAALSRLPSPNAGDEQLAYDEVVRAVSAAVRSPRTALAVQRSQELETVAVYGEDPSDDPWLVPLVHRGERLGELQVGRRTPGESYGRADVALLEQFGKQTSAMLYGLRRDAELTSARRSALAALADERVRLGRDLHDGLAPLLAGAGLTAEALRRGMSTGTSDERQAAQLAERLRTAASEIRRVAHDLQPHWGDGDLQTLISNQLAGLVGPGLPHFDLHVDVGDIPPETLNATYLVILEAVNNVVKHAHAEQAEIAVHLDGASSELAIVVCDDGVGLGQPYVSGLGLTSMRSRVEALGGSFAVSAGVKGGTRVAARIPVPR